MVELALIWLIVGVAVAWFWRDEKRLAADAALARAAQYYAFAPQYRHRPAEAEAPALLPSLRRGGLSEQQKAYFAAYGRAGEA